jgi:RNA polymerase sigma factor (TIGR02999 family)
MVMSTVPGQTAKHLSRSCQLRQPDEGWLPSLTTLTSAGKCSYNIDRSSVRWNMAEDNLTRIINSQMLLEVPPELYMELKKLARHALRSGRQHATLDTQAVVHEAVLKIYQKQSLHFESRGHFYALMSQIMRHTVIDYARKKQAVKQGGDLQQVGITQLEGEAGQDKMGLADLLAMDAAMEQLANMDPELEQMVMMRFYGGLDIKELAESFACSESTIKRSLRSARAFLKSQMS